MTENPEPETTGQTPPAAPTEPNAVDDGEALSRAEEAEPLERVEESEDQPTRQPNYWWQRPTIRALKREAQERRDYLDQQDERDNAATRLPAGESVHLGGLVLAEAFTPSTVSALYEGIRRWFGSNNRKRDEWIAELDRSRSGRSGGWSLGVVRRPGDNIFAIFDDTSEDSELPDSVLAVWLHLSYLMPSVAVVVATFTFRDEGADVSAVLRRDYHTQFTDPRIRVYGKFGRLRAWLPWSRPKNHGMALNMSRAEDGKRRAFEQVIHEREAECSRWFRSRFRGRFALADSAARPVARLIFTEKEVPFKDRSDWFRPIGLGWSPTIYRSVDIPGWALKEGQWPYARGRFVLTFAARRRDAAREPTKGESGEQNWDLTQRFNREQAPLVALYATHALLSLYGERLAKLRDGARARRRPRRPVRDALALDDYLTTDGLDAATITADFGVLTKDLRRFRRDVPEYTEDQEGLPDTVRRRRASPLEFVPALRSLLKEQAVRLATDTENTVGNIRGSAELKQAIANTRLQRTVMVVSLAALIVAIVGIFLAARPSGGSINGEVSPTESAPKVSVQLVLNHTAKSFGDTEVWYVVRVTNPSGSVASVALDVRALDSTGTIVGSSQETLPNIPAHGQFDYFGKLGGGGFSPKLTGTPTRIEISQPPHPFGRAGAVQLPMLKTSEITLTSGNPQDSDTDAPYSYNVTAKVTNTTGQELTTGVTQQVVLYDQAGHVVGGGTGASDNVPQTLPNGMSYRENWTGIPAVHRATRVAYTVWPTSF